METEVSVSIAVMSKSKGSLVSGPLLEILEKKSLVEMFHIQLCRIPATKR